MSTSEPSDSVMAMLIDGEDEQEVHELQTDAWTPIPKQRREISPSLSSNCGGDGDEGRRKKVLALSDTEGLFCPICMEAWESQGDHQVSCLPCGHVYGLSCIRRWIQQHGGIVAKCPQCNSKYNLKDIIKLFGSPIVVLDESLHKKVRSYEAEVASLKTERASLLDIQDDLFRVQENLFKELTNWGEAYFFVNFIFLFLINLIFKRRIILVSSFLRRWAFISWDQLIHAENCFIPSSL
ncbi:hypothetical protein FF2_001027 [Malus domestica]